MKTVYTLKEELIRDPDRVEKTQAMTLNTDKPLLGLVGTHGLFGSNEWWESIAKGTIESLKVFGTIEELIFAGMDSRWGDEVNSFRLRLEDGSTVTSSIYTNVKPDRKLFRVGAKVGIVYGIIYLAGQT